MSVRTQSGGGGKMKKFNIRKVLDGLKEASSSAPSVQVGPQENHLIQESIQSEHFQLCKTVRHGFPYQPSSMAFDPVQKILAIGTQSGALRLYPFRSGRVQKSAIRYAFFVTVASVFLSQRGANDLKMLGHFSPGTVFGPICVMNSVVGYDTFLDREPFRFGRPGVECYCQHESGAAVIQLQFLINEGALVSALADDSVHLWNLRQKRPAILHSLKFSKERITYCHLPFQSKWLYIGTERGNIHIVNVESFTLSGYVIMWNKAIELEPFMILSGGLSYDTVGRRPCLTVMHGKSTAVLEMDYPIVDFLTLCETPYPNDFQEPYAVVVLLEKDLVVIDLAQNGYPIFENPYPLTIHESPVTCCEYFADCPVDLIPALYSVGSRQKRQGYSKKEWPISGGNWGQGTQSYPEIIITGHADGTVKFWDASAIMLQVLYKLKTAKVFDRNRSKEDKGSTDMSDEDPFAIQIMAWCPESRMLCVAGVSANVIIYRFSKLEVTTEVVQVGNGSPSTRVFLQVRSTPLKQSPGYQVDLVVQLVWVSGEPPQQITSMVLNSSYGLVVFGNSNGLAVVDYIQKTVVLNLGTVELYGSNDPYQRQPRSPRKTRQPSGGLCDINEGSATSEDRCKSPTSAKMSRKLSLPTELKPDLDHRDNSFSRSRSSSVTSIDKEAREAISSFHFCETFARKGDSTLTHCLHVGTTLGTVLALSLTLPPAGEQRQLQPVIISPTGMLVRLKGSISRMAVLDSTGSLLPPAYEPWYEPNITTDGEEREKVRKRRPVSVSPSTSQDLNENQYAVVCSEKQAKVIALPSQTCIYKHSITETSFILRADVVQMSQGLCMACFCANGHIMTLSLPGLRPLMDVNYLPLTDMRIARTFCFTNLGQAMYLCSPTEIQRITYSQDTCENLQEMLGELFTPVETPEAPNRGFFKGLFGGGAQSLDREELFGELSSGKASRSLAQHIPGPGGLEGMKGAASGVVGDLARARIALDERGQKLGELEDRTAGMMASADSFSKHAHEVTETCFEGSKSGERSSCFTLHVKARTP
ncbi:hypothetical protein F2P81_024199 [Scophthalmus maximus]|uniref:V-SNARE coiled-coil homology domain-containing protein n=1 Tax=Scophthalmus maximus TaxID=52904 RepID=A0A6A4RTD5_SCOMX|nr:hypothetical protein F2P81_024199 [Scophthalmus maximus]